jgi:RNA polymerase sigma-70 factor (ECF subfamily)
MFHSELGRVCHDLRRRGLSDADAEDVSQDAFLVLWRRRAHHDARRPPGSWLAGLVSRVAYRHAGRNGREVPRGLIDAPDEQPTPEERAVEASKRSLVLELLAGLSERERAVLRARDVEGISMHEIAHALGIPLQTAYTRLRSGRRNFARLLRRRLTVADAKASLGTVALARNGPGPEAAAFPRFAPGRLAIHWRDDEARPQGPEQP